MENIIIIDDFFCVEHKKIIKDTIKNELWQASFMENKNNFIINNFVKPNNTYNAHNGDFPFWRIELENNEFFSNVLKNVIEEKMKKTLSLDRLYAVSQNYEQVSNFHTDCDKGDFLTFCYYINDIENEEYDGYFYVKLPNNNTIISITPKDNRAVCFPSTYLHRGSGFNKNCNKLRICVAWKFKTN